MIERTAVYRLFDAAGALLYVGISSQPEYRLRAHSNERAWWPEVARTVLAWHETRADALAEEACAIANERPRHNIAGTPLHRRVSGFKGHLSAAEVERWSDSDTFGARVAAITTDA